MTSSNALELCLTEIDELISRKRYAEALPRLQAVVLDFHDHTQPLVTSGVLYRQAKCLYHLGQYAASLDKLSVAISISRSGADHVLYAHQKQLMGFICRATGQVDEAVQAFLESYAARLRAGDLHSIYASLVNLGLSHMLRGDLQQGCTWFVDAQKYAEQYNSPEEVAICQINLCLSALLMGDFSRFRDVIRLINTTKLTQINEARVVELRGKFAVYQLDFAAAEMNLNRALNHHRNAGLHRDQVVCLEYLALNRFFQGDCARAKEYCQQILDMPEPTASAVAQTLRMLTDVLIAEGRWQEAEETAAKAGEAIKAISERIELGALHRAYGQIFAHGGMKGQAREHFGKSIGLLKELCAKYELALSHFTAGKSDVFSDTERSSHLELARELFVEMDVPRRVAEVNGAMAESPTKTIVGKNRPRDGGFVNAPVIIGQNEQIRDLLSRATKFAQTDCNILITGETGTGKDLVAQHVHAVSPRAHRKFVVVNSATMPESLLEAELFGACRGSYSGAERDRVGLIVEADGGSFFFDEISETPLFLQAKLLRVVETKVIRRVGDNRDYRCDVRFIAATNCDLWERVRAGKFREDLFYRLRRGHLQVPPLRERMDDLPLLVHHFLVLNGHSTFTPEQACLIARTAGLDKYHWQGNVRELQGVIDEAAAMWQGQEVMDLIPILRDILTRLSQNLSPLAERAALSAALRRNAGNKSAAARELGIPVTTLWNQLKKHGIN